MMIVNPINVMMGEVHTHFLIEASILPRMLNILGAHWVGESL